MPSIRPLFRALVSLYFMLLASSLASAQVNPGIPPLNDFTNGNFDVVNISNRNIFFSIPIRQKAGAIPFSGGWPGR